MMLQMHPRDLDQLIEQRQARLRAVRRHEAARAGLRMGVARSLIAAGTALGGERESGAVAESPARPPSQACVCSSG